jgi:hypothetical protein
MTGVNTDQVGNLPHLRGAEISAPEKRIGEEGNKPVRDETDHEPRHAKINWGLFLS